MTRNSQATAVMGLAAILILLGFHLIGIVLIVVGIWLMATGPQP